MQEIRLSLEIAEQLVQSALPIFDKHIARTEYAGRGAKRIELVSRCGGVLVAQTEEVYIFVDKYSDTGYVLTAQRIGDNMQQCGVDSRDAEFNLWWVNAFLAKHARTPIGILAEPREAKVAWLNVTAENKNKNNGPQKY